MKPKESRTPTELLIELEQLRAYYEDWSKDRMSSESQRQDAGKRAEALRWGLDIIHAHVNVKEEPMRVLEWAPSYGLSLARARWATAEEKKHLNPDVAEAVMYGIPGTEIELKELFSSDRPVRQGDGSFLGCNNQTWIISEGEWLAYVALNQTRREERERKELLEEIGHLEKVKADAEKQKDLPTDEEAKRRREDWIATQNEGGEGFGPDIISQRVYDQTCARLAELKAKL